jgi:hypothetical protein
MAPVARVLDKRFVIRCVVLPSIVQRGPNRANRNLPDRCARLDPFDCFGFVDRHRSHLFAIVAIDVVEQYSVLVVVKHPRPAGVGVLACVNAN